MVEVPSQANIIGVIKAALDALGLLDKLSDAVTKVEEQSEKIQKSVEGIKNIVKGLVSLNAFIVISQFKVKGAKKKVEKAVKLVDIIADGVDRMANRLEKSKQKIATAKDALDKLIPILDQIQTTMTKFADVITGRNLKINIFKSIFTWIQFMLLIDIFLAVVFYMSMIGLLLKLFVPIFKIGSESIDVVNKFLEKLVTTFDLIANMKINPITPLKITAMCLLMIMIGGALLLIAGISFMLDFILVTSGGFLAIMSALKMTNIIFNAIGSLVESISGIKTGIGMLLKIKSLGRLFKRMVKLFHRVNALVQSIQFMFIRGGGFGHMFKQILEARMVVGLIKGMVKAFAAMILPGLAMLVGYPILILAFKALRVLLRLIKRIVGRRPQRLLIRILALAGVVTALVYIGLALVMMGIIAIVLTQMIVPILLFMGIIIGVLIALKLIMMVMKLIHFERIIIGLGLLALVMLELLMVALSLAIIGVAAILIKEFIVEIFIFLGILVLFIIGLAFIGVVISIALPLLVIAAVGILVVVVTTIIIVAAIAAIATMLAYIALFEIDEDQVLGNVDLVLSIVWRIVERLWDPDSDPEEKRGPLGRIVSFVFGLVPALANIIRALLGVPMIVLAAISVGGILFIAAMLRLLQMLNLNRRKILRNVDSVFEIVDTIISTLFADRDRSGKESRHGVLLTIIKFFNPELGKILQAVLGLAYLALVTISIALILAIATMLRLLQMLKLDETKILKNIDSVFNTADAIINRIMAPRDEKGKESNRGLLLTIVKWVLGEGMVKILEAAMSLVYLFLIFVCITLVLAIATMLRMLQIIDLQWTEIEKNVNTIFNTCDLIINRIMSPRQEDEGRKSDRGILLPIVGWLLGEGMVKIFEAAMSIAYVFLMMICITIVLGIAELLKAIQDLEIDGDTIKERVNAIFDACDLIHARVFPKNVETKAQKSSSFLSFLISFFDPGLAGIIDSLMAIANVALIFAAISIVKGIAEHLKVIKDLDLKPGPIKTAIDNVFEVANYAIGKIMGDGIKFPEGSDKDVPIWQYFSPFPTEIVALMYRLESLNWIMTAMEVVANIAQAIAKVHGVIKNVDMKEAIEAVMYTLEIAEEIARRVFGKEVDFNFLEPKQEDKEIAEGLLPMFCTDATGNALKIKGAENEALKRAMMRVQSLAIIASAVGAMVTIAEGIKQISEIEIPNMDTAKKKVSDIIDAAAEIAQKIFGTNIKLTLPELDEDQMAAIKAAARERNEHWYGDDTEKGRLEGLQDVAAAQMEAAEARVQILSLVGSSIGTLRSVIDGIKAIMDFEIPQKENVISKIGDLLNTVSAVVNLLFGEDFINNLNLFTGGTNQLDDKYNDILEIVNASMECVSDIATSLTDAAKKIDEAQQKKLSMEDVTSIIDSSVAMVKKINDISELSLDRASTERMKTSLNAAIEILEELDKFAPSASGKNVNKNCELIDRVNDSFKNLTKVSEADVQRARNLTNNYIKFLDKIDSMDVKKLNLGEQMMRHFAAVTQQLKGDFNGLAKALNENIAPMLEKLNKTVETVNKCQEEIIKELSQPLQVQTPSYENGNPPSLTNNTTKKNPSDDKLGDESANSDTGVRVNEPDSKKTKFNSGRTSEFDSTTIKDGEEYVIHAKVIKAERK